MGCDALFTVLMREGRPDSIRKKKRPKVQNSCGRVWREGVVQGDQADQGTKGQIEHGVARRAMAWTLQEQQRDDPRDGSGHSQGICNQADGRGAEMGRESGEEDEGHAAETRSQ